MSRTPRSTAWLWVSALLALGAAVAACGGAAPKAPADNAPATAATTVAAPADQADAPLPTPAFESGLPEGVQALMYKPFTGDLDEMVKRRMIRLGVTFNRSFYFIDKGVQRGVAYEYGKLFEDELNKELNTGNMKINVLFVPLPRNMLASALLEGKIDAVIAQVTITPDKQKLVDFTNPTRSNVSEVVVTGPGAPKIESVADLSGQEVFVRKGGTYHQSLLALNDQFKAQGKPPVIVKEAPENLEDDDLLEMANAGMIPITIVDSYLAEFWKKVFTGLTVHDTVTVRTGGSLGVAIRKDSPKLKAALNAFLAKNGLGTAFGNMMEKRYLVSTKFVKNATSEAERKKMLAVIELFKKYGDQYDMDFLLMGAQGFQESGLNQDAKSPVGAIGIMQVMPATGAELKVGDITGLEANIHAGVKYMRFMIDQYFKDEPMDKLNKGLFAFASYNAGPGRVRQLRKEAAKKGLNPNLWFGNVEQIASERVGRETVTYVSNIYKYYIAYQLMYAEKQKREAAKAGLKQPGVK
ncbi:MAG: transporter substrate-binding domain-containing protein [Acidobacteria bacterium]|nr:transporter substrate-binding domain-containing protein [Acidobacteriota bacterium]